MSDDEFDAIVIGAAAAGEVAAGELADGGMRVAIVERERGTSSGRTRGPTTAPCRG
ncbi:MAG: FAD-dependent monooxygenase [Solirubrobacterales bacterium]